MCPPRCQRVLFRRKVPFENKGLYKVRRWKDSRNKETGLINTESLKTRTVRVHPRLGWNRVEKSKSVEVETLGVYLRSRDVKERRVFPRTLHLSGLPHLCGNVRRSRIRDRGVSHNEPSMWVICVRRNMVDTQNRGVLKFEESVLGMTKLAQNVY